MGVRLAQMNGGHNRRQWHTIGAEMENIYKMESIGRLCLCKGKAVVDPDVRSPEHTIVFCNCCYVFNFSVSSGEVSLNALSLLQSP